MDHKQVLELVNRVPKDLYINGEWREASGAEQFQVENPATREALASVANATPKDGMLALESAHSAQNSWGQTSSRERAELLRKAFDEVMKRADDFAMLMTLEMGKPLAESMGEVRYGAEFLRWFAEQAVQPSGSFNINPEGTLRIVTHRQPVGPSLLITPWNFPLAMAARKIAPALAAGCTVIIKPAALTPLTTAYFVQVLHEVGLPKGVVNLLQTTNAGAVTGPIIQDPRLRKLSFTGSTEVGRQLLKDASTNVLRTSMELGGNAPFLVFADADLDKAVDGAMIAKLRNMGEACTAANRFYAHEAVAEEFAEKLAEKMSQQIVGNGVQPDTTVGPLIDDRAVQKVESLLDDAKTRGAEVLVGGTAAATDESEHGYFYRPTVISKVPQDAEILNQEIFGPVAPIATFSTEEEAIALANSTDYGLIAYAFTEDVALGVRLSEQIESGMFALNTGVISNAAAPFGGVKHSGIGREGGTEGIEEYQTVRYLGMPL